jgi:hypothetical protein
MRRFAALDLFEQRPARLLKCRSTDHYVRIWIRRLRIIDPLHFRPNGRVFWLGGGDVYRRSNFNERKEFWCGLTMKSNTAMCPRDWMNEALVKSIGRRKLTPVPHRIANVASRSTAGGGDDAITLNAESVGAGALLFLFGINRKTASRRRLFWNADRTSHCHETAIAFHYINILFGKGYPYPHRRGIVRLVSGYVIRPAGDQSPPCTTRQKQKYSGTSGQC